MRKQIIEEGQGRVVVLDVDSPSPPLLLANLEEMEATATVETTEMEATATVETAQMEATATVETTEMETEMEATVTVETAQTRQKIQTASAAGTVRINMMSKVRQSRTNQQQKPIAELYSLIYPLILCLMTELYFPRIDVLMLAI